MSDFVKLTSDVLNVGDVTDLVADSTTGAIALFVGTTRDRFNDKKVVKLVNYDRLEISSIVDNSTYFKHRRTMYLRIHPLF
jgi:molybdopterin synthase catalytic subunit